jgi:ferric-dicitrate binding protein FerR (iron transport regulator)
MKPCEQDRLIQQYVEGELDATGQQALKEHLEQCPSCRQEFDQLQLLGEWVKDAFEPATPPNVAADRILDRIQDRIQDRIRAGSSHQNAKSDRRFPWPGRWAAAMASLACLALGLLFGAVGGRMSATHPEQTYRRTPVQIEVAGIEGTVLVRHAGADQWTELKPAAHLYKGDLLLSSARSSLTMRLKDNSTLMLEPNTVFHLSHYNGSAEFSLDRGALVADLNSPHPPFVVRTPTGAIQALGTKFRVCVK